ncbi:MAG: DUF1080 domain-containing protein [Phycisphaerales bacterium JB063]
MPIQPLAACLAAASLLALTAFVVGDVRETYMQWDVHDMSRPKPPVVTPGAISTQDAAGTAPSDAIVIFDGTSTDALRHNDGSDCTWNILDDGTLEVAPGQGGDVLTRQSFGDMQLHVEWMVSEDMPDREGQARGNSGVFLMNRYEVQILDCYENESYADGMAGSIYGQAPALANACNPRGQWQMYDIIFRRPHFDDAGNCIKPATVTVLHNGVLLQDHTEILGPTRHHARTEYQAHGDAAPFRLQDHGDKMRFRNIWVRELD